MTIFVRPSSPLAGVRSRVRTALLLALGIATILLAAIAAPAGAVVTEVPSGPTVGSQPRNGISLATGVPNGEFQNTGGAVVVHSPEIYVVYWDPTNRYIEAWQRIIDKFFQGVGEESGSLSTNFSVLEQYGDKSNAVPEYSVAWRGAYTDTNKYPAVPGCTNPGLPEMGSISCLTDAQLREQLQTFIAQHSLPKGMHTIFYVVTPPGVTVCADSAATHCSDYEGTSLGESYANSFCSYHSAINPGGLPTGDGNTILYAVLPWIASGFEKESFDCQDGGFDPSAKPPEKREKAKEMSAKEEKELAEKSAEEQAEIKRQRELEGPHIQEPNQPAANGEDHVGSGGLADLIVNQGAVELQNIDTDPLLGSWHDEGGKEVTDICRNLFDSSSTSAGGGGLGGHSALEGSSAANEETGAGTLANQKYGGTSYYLNNVYNLSAALTGHGAPCPASLALDPHFTAPNPVNAGEVIGFDGMESQIWLLIGTTYSPEGAASRTYSTFTWNFGDGSPAVSGYAPGAPACEAPWLSPCAASVFHSYQYGGNYTVTLRVRDIAGHEAEYARAVTVVGPPPPPPPSTGGGSGSGAGSGAGGSGGSGGSSSPAVPAPVAAYALVSKSLRKAIRSGLVIRYSVNEQVAGRFDVLLSRTLAHRLGISGTPAVGLPTGTPAQLVIAKAFIVTTKGGRSTVKIQFPKRTAQRLAKLHKVSLMLRLAVRNASRIPTTTTVLSSFTLIH